jgi:hypothetical protein
MNHAQAVLDPAQEAVTLVEQLQCAGTCDTQLCRRAQRW